MSKFKVGDKVKVNGLCRDVILNNFNGIIIGIDGNDGFYVRFPKILPDNLGHDCKGICEYGYGRWFRNEHLVPLIQRQKLKYEDLIL